MHIGIKILIVALLWLNFAFISHLMQKNNRKMPFTALIILIGTIVGIIAVIKV